LLSIQCLKHDHLLRPPSSLMTLPAFPNCAEHGGGRVRTPPAANRAGGRVFEHSEIPAEPGPLDT